MEFKILNKKEIKKTYNEKLKNDFPKAELKPYSHIKKMIKKGKYICYGFLDGEKINAYAFLAISDDNKFMLLDYFAVERELRNQGIGEVCLNMIAERLKPNSTIIIEVEDPENNTDKSYKSLRQRRINFYKRNNFIETDLKCDMCGVIMNIMYLPMKEEPTEEEIFHTLENFYTSIFPKNLTEKVMVFKS